MSHFYIRFIVSGFCQMCGSFLNKGIIMCGVTVTLCIMLAAFAVSVRLCCAGVIYVIS